MRTLRRRRTAILRAMPQDVKLTDLWRSARMNAETVRLRVWGQRIPGYRIDIASQLAKVATSVTISTAESSAGCAGVEAAVPEKSIVHSAEGGGTGAGGP